jgi:hypothetical protein
MAEQDEIEARAAYKRADAWARSAKGTPYGVTEPVRVTEPIGKPPAPLDPKAMAKFSIRKVK